MPFALVARPTLRAARLLLLLQSALVAPMSITPLTGRTRSFDVTFRRDGEEHVLRVPEGMPILQAFEGEVVEDHVRCALDGGFVILPSNQAKGPVSLSEKPAIARVAPLVVAGWVHEGEMSRDATV